MKATSQYNVILFMLLFLSTVKGYSQQTPILVNVEARLENILVLNMEPGSSCEFGIQKINDNLYQITDPPDDVMFSVESTGNWNLSISAAQAYFIGTKDSSKKIPVDFIGLSIENQGDNWDNGLFSNIANVTKDTIVSLSPDHTRLLENGARGNIGNASKNSFVLRWKFFYESDELRTKRFSQFDIDDDLYKVGFYITLSESTAYGRGKGSKTK